MDPSGNLPNSIAAQLPALFTFTNAKHTPRSAAPATRANLLDALRRFPPGTPGIFFFSGHATFLDVEGGLNAALELQDGDVIAAGDWLNVFDSHTKVGCPSRAVISACSSSGTTGTGGGEWLGLAAALLTAGARHVIATAWPIYDTPFTAQFDIGLVTDLEDAPDPAHALAIRQRAALAQWRLQDAIDNWDKALPAIWAAYQCIGTML